MAHLPIVDRLFAQGGSTWSCGSGSIRTWAFDFNTALWQRRATILPLGAWIGLEVVRGYDSVTGYVFVASPGLQLSASNPLAIPWTQRGTSGNSEGGGAHGGGEVAAIDPVQHRFVMISAGGDQCY